MPYALIIDGQTLSVWDDPDEAEHAARDLLRQQPDREPEIRDLTTGRPVSNTASAAEREQLANRIGY